MRIAHSTGFVCLAISGILLSGCATQPPAEKLAVRGGGSVSGQPIWPLAYSPRILSETRIVNGVPEEVELDGCVRGEITDIRILGVEGGAGISASVKRGTILQVESLPDIVQQGVVHLLLTTSDGMKWPVGFPVSAESLPSRRITFQAEEGTRPKSVSIAGQFNGWNSSANPLSDDEGDGIWETVVSIPPGKCSYKFVVDGNWLLDPANPNTVMDGGHENSLLVVGGERRADNSPLPIFVLPAGAPGIGPQGGFYVQLTDDARLAADGVDVFVNNVPLLADEIDVAAETGLVSLKVPEDKWSSQQSVSVVARDTTGRTGSKAAPFDFADAPRSPKDETIYYVVLDRFKNGNPSNDDPVDDPEVHPLNNFAGGDIAGVRQMIDSGYFDDLGATTLWISPPYVQPDIAFKDSKPPHRKLTGYHGYWPTDMRNVEPRWGTVEEFRAMVDDAHQHDMAVIIDFVSNHLHEDNPMVREHPDWFSKLELPDGTLNIRQYDTHPFTTWFDDFLPDIAYDKSSEATDYMTNTAVWWLEETNADGFRHDAVKHVPNVFWETTTRKLNEQIAEPAKKRIYQVGETVSSRSTINHFIGPRLLDGQFDFPLFWSIESALAWETSSMSDLAGSLQESVDDYPVSAIMSPFIGNHDVPRFMSKAEYDSLPGKKHEAEEDSFTNPAHVDDSQSYEKLKLAFSFLLTVPGGPMMYYGDEIGMTGSGRPDSRRMFLPPEAWDRNNQDTYQTVRALLHARQESIALRRGDYQLLQSGEEHIVFARISPEEVVIVALQRKTDEQPPMIVDIPEAWGHPVGIEALALNGLGATSAGIVEGGRVRIEATSYSGGAWRLVW
ncbi:hypothetical protein KQI84_02990 [bacterium]|nr:hypothetical protein [bacterium]